jgi:uncharacterized damage-inducible protein DinB
LKIMIASDNREVWQRGPVEGIPPLLQPVAHALLQVVEEAERHTENFPADLLWKRPADVASVGFHLLHIRGVIDRLFTYALGKSLTAQQLEELSSEKQTPAEVVQPKDLVNALSQQVEIAIVQLRNTPESTLSDKRAIGRKQIPTTVGGLLFHAAEHSQRHIGQLLVTARIVQDGKSLR